MRILDGARVMVVGGSSGIGLAAARAACGAGADVTIAARSGDRLQEAASALGAVQTMRCDIGEADQVESLFRDAGDFDHVVVSAGGVPPGTVRGKDASGARAGFDAKFWGAWHVASHARLAPRGSMTFVSGVFAVRPAPRHVAASCANAAIEALVRGLAVELSPQRVNAVSPGLVDTPMYAAMPSERRRSYFEEAAAKLPARTIGRPEDVAAMILTCMSNPYLTGTILTIDGGHVLV
jgi:NAD(P)-dependent dehydrogenase (short-subunit alcohol dehydrogenase family)